MNKTVILIGLLLVYSLLRWENGFLLFNIVLTFVAILAFMHAKLQYRLDGKRYNLIGNFSYYLGLFVGLFIIIVEFIA